MCLQDVIGFSPDLELAGPRTTTVAYESPLPSGVLGSIFPCLSEAEASMRVCGAVAKDPATGEFSTEGAALIEVVERRCAAGIA